MHKYEVNNWHDELSNQRYPVCISSVTHVDFPCKKYPNGWLQLSVEDVDGHFCSMVKCYINKKGEKYGIFGKHRIYEGYQGAVELIGVPYSHQKCIQELANKYGSIVS